MSYADGERLHVSIKHLQKPVNLIRTSPKAAPLAMEAIEISNSFNQRLRRDLNSRFECFPFIRREVVDVPRDRQRKCRVRGFLGDDARRKCSENCRDCANRHGTDGDGTCTDGRRKCPGHHGGSNDGGSRTIFPSAHIIHPEVK